MKDGLLSLELVREIPEAMKPRRIEIGGSEQNTIESRPSSEVTPRHDSVKEDA
jgi:molecular chaperone IbpA